MIFDIAHKKLLHDYLITLSESTERFESSCDDEPPSLVKGYGVFSSKEVTLLTPLNTAKLVLKTSEGHYSAEVEIRSDKKVKMLGLSEMFATRICPSKDSDLEFICTDQKGTGYLTQGGQTVFSIARFSPYEGWPQVGRILAIGSRGAMPLETETNFDDFERRIIDLELMVRTYIRSIYELNKVAVKNKEDLTLSLNCLI